MIAFSQRKKLTDLENKLFLCKWKGGWYGKLRLGLPYVYKYLLNTFIKETDHIAREVNGALCNNLHGKSICT